MTTIKNIKEKLADDSYYLPVEMYDCPAFFDIEAEDKAKAIKSDILAFFDEYNLTDETDTDSDTFTEKLDEWCDSNVNPYNTTRLQWLANNLNNAETVNDTVKEYGIDSKEFDLFNVLGMAMVRANYESVRELINDIESESN